MITNPKLWKFTSSWTSACVPITTSIFPFFRSVFTAVFCLVVVLHTSKWELTQNCIKRSCIPSKCWRARISVGAIIATWILDPSFSLSLIAWIEAIWATTVFPVQTSHSSSLCIEWVFSISFKAWKRTIFWWSVKSNGIFQSISFTKSALRGIAKLFQIGRAHVWTPVTL